MASPARQPLSPIPGLGLEGYANQVTVSAGDKIQFLLSGPSVTAKLTVARLIHGDPNPAGPGYREQSADWAQPKSLALSEQFTNFGSYVEIPHAESLNPPGDFTLGLWFYPTKTDGRWQTLAAKWTPGSLGYALFYAGDRFLTAAVSHDGVVAQWATARETAHLGCWHFVAVTYECKSGQLALYQCVSQSSAAIETRSSHDPLVISPKRVAPGPVHRSEAPLLFGALARGINEAEHWAHFTGKIGHPILIGKALDRDEVWALSQGDNPPNSVLGCWDFGQEVTGMRVIDVSPFGHHGSAVNAPGRAVTGPFWSGMPSRLYTESPKDYNAIYCHEDDLEDARWSPTCEVSVPADARSGIYAAQLEAAHDRLFLPFIVRPSAPRARLACLIPTLTWQAYGSNCSAYSYTEDGVLDRGLSLYNVHSDGSMVFYRTRLQPTRYWNPTAGFQHWGAHTITANLYLLDWLEAKGLAYDVYADEDLHQQQNRLLAEYPCVILGSHSEYWTQSMVDAMAEYTQRGGRVVNLGGNGQYWVTSMDEARPHLMEVRRGGEGDYGPTYVPEPGESQHSTTLELGGLWSRRGCPPHRLLGVEHAANLWHHPEGPCGFRRLPASHDPRYAFIFRGVGAEETIGDFGLNLGTAAGFEMDAIGQWARNAGTPEPVLLARATHPSFVPPRRAPVTPASDITLLIHRQGGAVFSAGSVTWTGSLSHNNYENNVSQITENVLRRFIETPISQTVFYEEP